MNRKTEGYTLVVCEKPDAVRRISDALSDGRARASREGGVVVYRFSFDSQDYVACAVFGHAYGVSDPFGERTVYPVLDAEWYPASVAEKTKTPVARSTAVLSKLSEGASRFVNACDFDVEGETIGFNVLRYACRGAETKALRAKFSTLSKTELVEAFRRMGPQPHEGFARAGRARHMVDFAWGVNLSRFLSHLPHGGGRRYRTVSIGRVQGPTLKFVVDREREIEEFVPIPFWKVTGFFTKGKDRFEAPYAEEKVRRRSEADEIVTQCKGKEGAVQDARQSVVDIPPPPPFSTGDLQKEAFRALGLLPGTTLRLAEKLYLAGLISYPRTGSQKLPASIGYRRILEGLAAFPEYSTNARELMLGKLSPREGPKTDQAHPAIFPTGERPRRAMERQEGRLYDLVVRRFLAAFAPSAKREVFTATVKIGRFEFRVAGARTLYAGWMAHHGTGLSKGESFVSKLSDGDRVKAVDVRNEERFDEPPERYNHASLLEKMERNGIGTKSTRAETISTLIGRGYVLGEGLAATDLGFSVVEAMQRYAPTIVSTGLTRRVEARLEAVEGDPAEERELLREAYRSVTEELVSLSANEEQVGLRIGSAASGAGKSFEALGRCPVCRTGELRIVRSRKTRKRFVGCSNYTNGCRASAPLPQRGSITKAAAPCPACSWPVVYVGDRRRPWKLCVNLSCPLRREKAR